MAIPLAFTSDNTARFTGDFTSINPGGFGSNWCGSSFVVSGRFDLTAMANLKSKLAYPASGGGSQRAAAICFFNSPLCRPGHLQDRM